MFPTSLSWIDALFVNQFDVLGKTEQVMLMDEIFRRSVVTVAVLDSDDAQFIEPSA